MSADISSKTIDGITDLVVVAPIKEGFINAYENITYATRLRVVAEALNRIRVSAREHEFTVPFSDVTERIVTLLDFRIGVLDKGLFTQVKTESGYSIEPRRYLYLTATFDSAFEPYMRLIWDPLGPFLDLIFCNCDGYVPAGDNSCEDFLRWVRENQVDSAIFYATSGASIRDDRYHATIDRLLRAADFEAQQRELATVRQTMVDPQFEAKQIQDRLVRPQSPAELKAFLKLHELALEVLTVLFRLADFYPPEWQFRADVPLPDASVPEPLEEGKYLARVAYSILLGWERATLPAEMAKGFIEPLQWYDLAAKSASDTIAPNRMNRPVAENPPHDPGQVQGGILGPQDAGRAPILEGALLMMTVTGTNDARAFLRSLKLHYHGDAPDGDFYRTIGFTADGLKRLAVFKSTIDAMPKEFREGMAERSGHIGDMRELHPRRWTLPPRNWPDSEPANLPPVDPSEVDFIIQLRHAPSDGDVGTARLTGEIDRIGLAAAKFGVRLVSVQTMNRVPSDTGGFSDHFGFADGLSQPHIRSDDDDHGNRQGPWNNSIARGDILLGYGNDRDDHADNGVLSRAKALMKDGSFLVVRKLEQRVEAFNRQLEEQAARLRCEGYCITADDIAYRIIGRRRDGTPLVPTTGPDLNRFAYDQDGQGQHCPFAAHIRRTNPRTREHGRPTPRIVRRGMSYGPPLRPGVNDAEPRGLMFMCYQSSIAEQFEVIQRWINGGNSTGIATSQNDPLLGVAPKAGPDRFGQDRGNPRLFRFEWQGRVVRVEFDEPFVELHWGLYLFVPSRSGMTQLSQHYSDDNLDKAIPDFPNLRENAGDDLIDRIEALPPQHAEREWKRLLEDFDAKDPGEQAITQNIWSAIRWYKGGAYRLEALEPPAEMRRISLGYGEKGNFGDPPVSVSQPGQPTVLVASQDMVGQVLANWKKYSVEEQLSRIEKTSGSIYVTQQPDDKYNVHPDLNGKYDYAKESYATNQILMDYGEAQAFELGRAVGEAILRKAKTKAAGVDLPYFKLELRRQYLMPALGSICSSWFGIPGPLGEDDNDPHGLNDIMVNGGWDWNRATDPKDLKKELRKARCPGDCLSPSRGAFYPRPTQSIQAYAADHGPAIRKAGEKFIDRYFGTDTPPPGWVSSRMFEAMPGERDILARNLIGIMVGAMPPMDGNLRGILVEWLGEKTLWRNQAAYARELASGKTPYAAAKAALWTPMTRAMCKRPAPDLIHRVALEDDELITNASKSESVSVKRGDMVIVSLVGASQQSLFRNPADPGDVSPIFGGKRKAAAQGYDHDNPGGPFEPDPRYPVHACPAQDMAMGAMMGVLAALLEAGRIEALPAALILKISGERLT